MFREKTFLNENAASEAPPTRLRLESMFSRLKKSVFIRNLLVVMTGTAAAQILGFGLTPVISRLFSPSDFGILGSFNSIVTIVGAGATLQYSQAIMLPKVKEDASNLLLISCICTFAVVLLCLLIFVLAPSFVAGLMKTKATWALALLIVAVLVSGLNESCQAWCVRVKAFKRTSASQVIRSLSSNGMQIGSGYLNTGAPGLVVSSIFADVVATTSLARVAFRDLRLVRGCINWKEVRRLAVEYRDFPIYSASTNVISSLSLGLPVLLLTHFYGIAVAGAYAFGSKILTTPMSFVLTALRQVLFQKAAETNNNGDRLMPLYLKITLGLFSLAILPAAIIFLWAPPLFAWVFGARWYTAGEFASSLTLWMVFMFCNVPAVLFARIIRIQRKMAVYDLTLLSLRATVLILGGIYLTAVKTIMAVSILGAVMNIAFIVIVGLILHRKEKDNDLDKVLMAAEDRREASGDEV